MRFLRYLILALLILPAIAQTFDGTVSVQAIANSFTGSDVTTRTNYPVGFPYMFKSGDIADTSTLKLTGMGVSAGQFLVTSRWPDNTVKSIWVDATANYTGVGNTMTLALTGGSGNFGGSDLAVNNAKIAVGNAACEATGTSTGYICVNTGVALFEIRKADYAGPTKVVVNGKVIVDDAVRANPGLVIVGPPNANDTASIPPAPTSAPTVEHVACDPVDIASGACPTAARTYAARVSYVNANGESLPSTASASASWVAGERIRVTCPSGAGVTPAPLGCYVYVGPGGGDVHLQQAVGKPLALGATWIEPLNEVVSGIRYCHLTLRDGSLATVPQTSCQGTGGVLYGTSSSTFAFQKPQAYAVAGNSGCTLEVPNGAGGYMNSCTTAYKSSLDDGSDATIEQNGPAKVIIKGIGSYASSKKTCPAGSDSSGNETVGCYLHYTDRMTFYKGASWMKRESLNRNADYVPYSTANETRPGSDVKGYRSWTMETALAGADVDSGAKTYSFKANTSNTDCTAQVCTGSLTGDALLYQGYHPIYERYEQNGRSYSEYVPSLLMFRSQGGATAPGPYVNAASRWQTRNGYLQEGYLIQANGAYVTGRDADEDRYDPAHEVGDMGWADVRDTNGRGIQIGLKYMAAAYPGELKFSQISSNNYNAVIGLNPNQTDPIATGQGTNSITGRPLIDPQGAKAYYIPWPQYELKETFWNFHDTALSTPGLSFQSYQQELVGRPALKDVNRSGYFTELYPLINPSVFDGYIKNTVGGSMATWTAPGPASDTNVQLWIRAWDPRQSGEGNQNELAWSNFMNWLQRGGDFATSYLYARMYYRQQMTNALPRADFSGGWRGTCDSTTCKTRLDRVGFPKDPSSGNSGGAKYPVGNMYYASRDWNNDAEHMHIWGMFDFAPLSGDPAMMEFTSTTGADVAANPNISNVVNCPSPGPCYLYSRSLGWALQLSAHAYTYLQSQGATSDATNVRTKATNIMDHELPMTTYGYGFGSQMRGQSPVTGLIWNGSYDGGGSDDDDDCPFDTNGSCDAANPYGSTAGFRITTSFFENVVIQSLLDSAEAYGPSWDHYQKALDQAYGTSAGIFGEGLWVEHGKSSSCTTRILQNIPACFRGTSNPDGTANPACYPGNPCSGFVYWLNMEFYNSDKLYYLGHDTPNAAYFTFIPAIILTGNADSAGVPNNTFKDPVDQNVDLRDAVRQYLQLRGPNKGAEDGAEEWSSMLGMFMDEDGNVPPAPGKLPLTHFTWKRGVNSYNGGHWIDVPFTNSGCSGQNYCTKTGASPGNLTWATPASAVAYRMKMNSDADADCGADCGSKQIQDVVRIDNITNPHADGSGCASRATGTSESGGVAGIAPNTISGTPSPYADSNWWWGCGIDDPRYKWPWFSSGEVSNPPSAGTTSFDPTTVQRGGAGAWNSANHHTFALRAYVTSSVPTAYLTGNSPIIQGESSTLQWTTTNVTSASINQGIGTVALTGSTVVSPAATTTYTLTATGPNGSAVSSFTVVVTPPPPVPTATLSVNPAVITAGQSATLSWATTDANTISISPGIGTVGASGTWSVTPATTTTYTITATGLGGTVQAQTTLTVNPVIPPGATGTTLQGATAKGAVVQ